ncbi:hypothetical protein GDO81_020623, partial [Engystomops pustulosus]
GITRLFFYLTTTTASFSPPIACFPPLIGGLLRTPSSVDQSSLTPPTTCDAVTGQTVLREVRKKKIGQNKNIVEEQLRRTRVISCCWKFSQLTMEVENPSEINANLVDNDSLFYGDIDQREIEQVRTELNGNLPVSSLNEARLHAKAKRRLRKNSSRDSGRGDSVSDNGENGRGLQPTSPKTKLMDRKSRTGKGRGLPKKGGAGGKGVWGTPGQIYDEEEVDIKDPNYDEDQENCVYETTVLPLDEEAFEKSVTPIVQEYFQHGDTNEVAVGLSHFGYGYYCSQWLSLCL